MAEFRVLREARIAVCTCTTSAITVIKEMQPTHLILDEAGQSTIPDFVIPLMTGPKHVVLIGDQLQLPPLVISYRV